MRRFLALLALAIAPLHAADPPAETGASPSAWTERDTRNANHYLRLLEEDPAFGNVLEILWQLYEKHEATDLLIETYARDANRPGRLSSRIVHSHLLRRRGDLEAARSGYEAVLAQHPDNRRALAGLVDVCRELADFPAAAAGLDRYLQLLPPNDPERAQTLFEIGRLRQESGDGAGARAAWDLCLESAPGDAALREAIVRASIAAGMLEEAIRHIGPLTEDPDPEKRLAAWKEQARLQEAADQFEPARSTLLQALGQTHFRHPLHEELFQRLVRLHERFEQLPELERDLLARAGDPAPSEEALRHLARFYALTVRPREEEAWLRRLADAFPENDGYQQDLVRCLLGRGGFVEAASRLDRLLASGQDRGPQWLLLRCELDLQQDRREEAQTWLLDALERLPADAASAESILPFARARSLDRVTETLLLRDAERHPDDEQKVFALAEFHLQRRRPEAAETLLDAFIQRAAAGSDERVRRLDLASELLRGAGAVGEAARAAEAALEAAGGRDQILRLAEIHVQQGDPDLALQQWEQAWTLSQTDEERIDVDERILALLQQQSEPAGEPADLYDESKRSAVSDTLEEILRQPETGGGLSPVPPNLRDRVLDFYQALASRTRDSDSLPSRLRLAWWAFRTGNYADAYPLLLALVRDHPDHVASIRLFFELCNASGDLPRAARQLERLADLEPDRRTEHLRRLAELELGRGQAGRAAELLEPLAADPDAAPDLLETLARARQELGESGEARRLLSRALDASRGGDRRRLLDSSVRLLEQLGDTAAILDVTLRVVREETDPEQRRKLLESQVTHARRHGLLEPLAELYRRESRRQPFDTFYLTSLSSLHQALGQWPEAFALLRRAYYLEPDSSNLLPQLRDLALRVGQSEAAVYFQRQLLAEPESGARHEEWEKLIELLENDFRAEEAETARERMERRFSQNADVLLRLAEAYQREKRPERALAARQKLNRLRAWDSRGLFAEARLLEAVGRPREAAAAFLRLLDREATPAPAGASTDAPPILHWFFEETAGVDPFQLHAIQETELLAPDSLEELAEWFRRRLATLRIDPAPEPLLRLLSVRHAARLLRETASPVELRSWIDQWNAAAAERPSEALWALFYAGATEEAWELLRDRPPSNLPERFCRMALGLSLGKEADLAGEAGDDRELRSVLWAARAWLWVTEPNHALSPEFDRLQAAVPLPRRSVQRLAEFLASRSQPGAALAIGASVPPRPAGSYDGPRWAEQLSRWAGAAGLPADRDRYLDQALTMITSPAGRSAAGPEFETVFRDRLRRARSAEDFLSAAARGLRLSEPAHAESSPLRRAWIDGLLGDSRNARASVRAFVRPATAAPADTFPEITGEAERSFWEVIPRAAESFAENGMPGLASFLLREARTSSPVLEPPEPEARAAAAAARHLELVWNFETLSYPERRSLLRRELAGYPWHDGKITLAQTLETYGYSREAIPIYEQLLAEDPDNSTRRLGFLRACREALEYGPAIRLLQAAVKHGTDEPGGARAALQNHDTLAHFLSLAGREEELRDRARQPIPAYERRQTESPYLRELAELLLREERTAAAAEVLGAILRIRAGQPPGADRLDLSSLSWTRTDDKRFALLLGQACETLGRWEEAGALYTALAETDEAGSLDRQAVQRLAAVHAASGHGEQLLQLGRRYLERGQLEVLPDVAAQLEQSGDPDTAGNLLRMAARRPARDGSAFDLLLPLATLELRKPAPLRIEDWFEPLFECAVENAALRSRYLKVLLDDGLAHRAPLLDFLHSRAQSRERRVLALLSHAALLGDGDLPAPLLAQWNDPAAAARPGLTDHNLMAGVLFERGHAAEARRLYDRELSRAFEQSDLARPLYLKLLLATGDRAAVRALHARLLAEETAPNPLNLEMFREQNLPQEALRLGRRHVALLAQRPPPDREFDRVRESQLLEEHASLLLDLGLHREAQAALRRASHRGAGNLDLLERLCRSWPDQPGTQEAVRAFHLPSGLLDPLSRRLAQAP